MRFEAKNIRAYSRIVAAHWLAACLLILLAAFAAAETAGAQKQIGTSAANSPLTTNEVVKNLVGMNLRRAQALHSYHGTRIYRAEYRSSLKTLSAEMVVEVNYFAPDTKEFTIKSSTGSKLIIDKVFKKILQAEEDALSKDAQQSTALSRENYDFTMVGYESTPLQSTYILAVEPKTKSKLLFRGKVWIDAKDFALSKVEAEPAKNPSFWTKSNEIKQSYKKVDEFWLPELNHSTSAIRIGGRAELTIEYQNYRITAADPVGNTPARDVAGSAKADFTLDARKHLLAAPLKREP